MKNHSQFKGPPRPRLSLRHSTQEVEKALSISNDISEDIDNHETRAVLRQAICVFADMLSDECQEHSAFRVEVLRGRLRLLSRPFPMGWFLVLKSGEDFPVAAFQDKGAADKYANLHQPESFTVLPAADWSKE